MASERTRNYELVLVLSPQANDDEVNAAVERVSNFITQRGGSVTEQQRWGVRRLAYPVKRFQEGIYHLTKFSSDPRSVVELDRTLNISDNVLRHLVMNG